LLSESQAKTAERDLGQNLNHPGESETGDGPGGTHPVCFPKKDARERLVENESILQGNGMGLMVHVGDEIVETVEVVEVVEVAEGSVSVGIAVAVGWKGYRGRR
jgi:hypothetical protein